MIREQQTVESYVRRYIDDLKGVPDAIAERAAQCRKDRDAAFRIIAREASYLATKLSLQAVSAHRNETEIDLRTTESMAVWFSKRENRYRDDFAGQLSKDIGLSSPVDSFAALLTSYPFDTQTQTRLMDKVFVNTWGKERGYIFEWFAFLGLARRPVLMPQARELRLGASGAKPIKVRIGDLRPEVFLWYQKSCEDPRLRTKLRPDFSLTSDDTPPSEQNLEGIVECKSMESITSVEIREVWAKKELLNVDYAVLAVDAKVSETFEHSCMSGHIRLKQDLFSSERLQEMDLSGRATVCTDIREAVKRGREQRDSVEALRERLTRMAEREARRPTR